MRLNLRRSSRAEDCFEKWIAQRHEERVLAGDTIVPGPCPDKAFLEDLARRSRKVALSDPQVDHTATCPICMNQLLALRHEHHSRRQKLVFATAVAVCVICHFAKFGPNGMDVLRTAISTDSRMCSAVQLACNARVFSCARTSRSDAQKLFAEIFTDRVITRLIMKSADPLKLILEKQAAACFEPFLTQKRQSHIHAFTPRPYKSSLAKALSRAPE